MITLKISFLLAINLKKEVKQGKKSKKDKIKKVSKERKIESSKINKGKIKKFKKNKETKNVKDKHKKENRGKPPEIKDVPYVVIDSKNPSTYVRIEYEMFEKKFKYWVDVVCWGLIAKIYSADGIKCLKPVVTKNILWIPIFVEHYLNHLTTEEVRGMLKQTINCNIKVGKNNLGVSAKSDKNHIFYLGKEDVDRNEFIEVSTEKPEVDGHNNNIQHEIARIIKKILTFPINHEIVTWIYDTDETHMSKISNIILRRSRNQEVYTKDFHDENEKHEFNKSNSKNVKQRKDKKKKKSVKNKKSKKGKKNTNSEEKSTMSFKIPAQVLLTDPVLATYQINPNKSNIEELFILLSSNNLLTLQQKHELNPLVLKVHKISNFPCDVLQKNGFKKVYAVCDIPYVDQFKTIQKPITETVRFNESHYICTRDVPPLKIFEILETQRIIVTMYGVKEIVVKETLESVLKEKSKKRKKSSNKKKNKSVTTLDSLPLKTRTEIVTLSITTFDLSSLAKSFWLFKEKGQCLRLHSFFTKKRPKNAEFFIDRLTVNEINLLLDKDKANESPLTDDILIKNGTTLKIEAYFLIPQYPSFQIRGFANTYKRLLLIIFKEELAKLLFNEIFLYNHNLAGSGPEPLLIPYTLGERKRRPGGTSDLKTENVMDNMLTGFLIDDGNSFIFFIEGPSNGFILTLVHQLSRFNYSTAKVFYNSEYLFEDRLYEPYSSEQGFFLITLKMPLRDLFSKNKIYLQGNVPVPTFKAFQKLHLLINSLTFKSILNYDLLPTQSELLSFGLEFGLQLKYKSSELNRRVSLKDKKSEILGSHTDLFGKIQMFQ